MSRCTGLHSRVNLRVQNQPECQNAADLHKRLQQAFTSFTLALFNEAHANKKPLHPSTACGAIVYRLGIIYNLSFPISGLVNNP